MYKSLKEKYFEGKVEVSLLQKYQGLNFDNSYKEQLDSQRFELYFKGPFKNFENSEIKVSVKEFKLVKIIQSHLSSSVLPIGMTSDLNLLISSVSLEEKLIGKVVAVLHLENSLISELDENYEKINSYVDQFVTAPVSYICYM